jgi:hypothetical protein
MREIMNEMKTEYGCMSHNTAVAICTVIRLLCKSYRIVKRDPAWVLDVINECVLFTTRDGRRVYFGT